MVERTKLSLKELCEVRTACETLLKHPQFIGDRVRINEWAMRTEYHIKHYDQYQQQNMGVKP